MKKKDQTSNFDFDEWAELARDNPEEFERLRGEAIRHMIDDAPEEIRRRMEGLQWQIDQMRDTAKTPMASCLKISSMMWDNVLGEDGLVQSIENLNKSPQPESNAPRKQAHIIDFGKSSGKDE